MAERIVEGVIQITQLHRRLGEIVRRVALSGGHVVVEKGGLPVAVLMSVPEYQRLSGEAGAEELNRLVRVLSAEADRQGISEEQLIAELKEDKKAVYREMYGDPPK